MNEIVEIDGKKVLIVRDVVEPDVDKILDAVEGDQEESIEDAAINHMNMNAMAAVTIAAASCHNMNCAPFLSMNYPNRGWNDRSFRSPKRSQAKRRKHNRQCH